MVYSVLRRYTPPTCTLEIMAKNSPLSRWAGQPVLKNLRFQLSLDDPKLPQAEWVMLRGDRTQLEALTDAVQTYIQHFLEQSHTHFSAAFSSGEERTSVARSIAPVATAPAATHTPTGISLQPTGLLSHELQLGSLATAETGGALRLSTLQLFDLANALDDYMAEVLTLPSLPQASWLRPARPWGQVAAAAVLLVGVSASMVKLLDGHPGAVPTASQGASSSDQRIASQLPPSATGPNSGPSPLPSTQPVPVPPPLGSTTPPVNPGAPTVSVDKEAPSGSAASQSSGESASGRVIAKATQKGASQNQTSAPSETVIVGRAEQGPPTDAPTIVEAPRRAAAVQPSAKVAEPAAPSTLTAADRAAETRRAAIAAEEPGTAFDVVPQVAEARTYFQANWKPPQDLTQKLEYTLVIDPSGAIQSVSPLGEASQTYQDRAGLPPQGQGFVSPPKDGKPLTLRLVLSPDGTVQTFQQFDSTGK